MAAEVTATPAARKRLTPENRLTKQQVELEITSPAFRDNLVLDLRRLGYRKPGYELDNAVQTALLQVLTQPDLFFTSQAGLRKWAFDTARGFLISEKFRTPRFQGRAEEQLTINIGSMTDGANASDDVPSIGDANSFGPKPRGVLARLNDLEDSSSPRAELRPDGAWGANSNVWPDFGTSKKKDIARRRVAKKEQAADKKQREKEEAIRTAPGKPVIKRAGQEFIATAEDYDVFATVRAYRGTLRVSRPDYEKVKKAVRKKGWAGARENNK